MKENEFYQWEETSRDTLDFKKIYVDVAGDLVAGIVLSEIVYWNLPNKKGETKLRIERNGLSWIAAARADWLERARVTPKQLDRALDELVKRKIILKELFRFNGSPTIHIHLEIDNLLTSIVEIQKTGKWISPKGENPIIPKGEMDIDEKVIPLTETTTETTTENTIPCEVLFPENLNTPEFKEKWLEWIAYRKEIKHPIKVTTQDRQIKSLVKYSPDVACAMIEQSITNGWQGIFPIKENSGNGYKSEGWVEVR